jgi:hypothetical protein
VQDSYLPSSCRRTRYLSATKPQKRGTSSAPSKGPSDWRARHHPTIVGGGFALLARNLPFLAC